MTRKDYIIIAEAIRSARYGAKVGAPTIYAYAIDQTVLALVKAFNEKYPNFDEKKFLSAAEIGKLPRVDEVA